jgi:accessory gene regulator B
MIARLSTSVSSHLLATGIIPAKERDVYAYGFEVLFATLLNLFAVCAIAVSIDILPQSACYLAGFVPLRSIAGGFHAKSHFRCFLILMSVFTAFILLLKFLPSSFWGAVILGGSVFSIITIYFLAPIADSNKPLSFDQKKTFRRISRIAILVYAIAILSTFIYTAEKGLSFSASLGVTTCVFSLIAGKIKNLWNDRRLPHGKETIKVKGGFFE